MTHPGKTGSALRFGKTSFALRALILGLALVPLTACGFTPVYGSGPELASSGPISIPEIPGRAGHVLRQELVRTIGRGVPGVTGSANLEVTLNQSIERLAFAPDEAASRSDYVGTATWRLRGASGLLLASGGVSERASFNFADAPYADLAAQTAAQERLGSLLARSIREQILVEAGKPKTAAPAPSPAQ
jgi:LPS-assembly lipoprotein